MNKLTLSAAALTAIVAPVQVQAADLSPEMKAKEIQRVNLDLTAAINEIGKMNMAVQKIYLVTLSGISADINTYDGTDKVLTEETVKGWEDLIASTKKFAENDQMPYTSKDNLDAILEEFYTAYNDAVERVKAYELAGPAAKKTLDGYKSDVDKIKTTIDGFDLTEHDIVGEEPILKGQISTKKEAITTLLEKIVNDEKNLENKSDATNTQKLFQAAYDAAKDAYKAQRKAAAETLPVDPYQDFIDAVNAQLNGQSRLLDELKAADDAQLADVIANPTDENKAKYATDSYERKLKAEGAEKAINGFLGSYVEKMNIQDAAKDEANTEIAAIQKKLTDIKTELANEVTDLDGEIADAQAQLDAKTNEVKEVYKKHEIAGYNLNLDVIDKIVGKIVAKGEALVANYDANADMTKAVEKAQTDLDATVKAASEASKDKYDVTTNFAGAQKAIQDAINALSAAVKKANEDKKSVELKKTFSVESINTDIANYAANTTAALAAYDKAQEYIKTAKADRDKLVDVVKDETVAVDGTTYEAKITKINNDIKKIEKAVADAIAVIDDAVKHLADIEKASNMTVSENIKKLTTDYTTNKETHDKQSAINAAQNVIDAADSKIDDIEKILETITGDFGFQQKEIDDKNTNLSNRLESLKTTLNNDDVEAFKKEGATFDEKAELAQKVIAALSTVVVDLEGEDGKGGIKKEVNDLKTVAEAAAANTRAYKDVVETLVPNVNTAIAALRAEAAKATGDAKTFFESEADRLETAVNDAKTEMETAYNAKKAVDEKGGIEKKLNGYKKEATALKGKVVPNENAHGDQVEAVENLEEFYNKRYNCILDNDMSDAAAGYLQQLQAQKKLIETLKNTTIPEAFKNGNSDTNKEAIEKDRKAIEDAITTIVSESYNKYEENVNKTNAAQHANFEEAFKAANTAFSDAVKALNEFSNIKNGALQTAMDNLIKTHDDIYAYADSLRNLKSQEFADYTEYVNGKVDGVDDIYSSQKHIDEAVKFTGEINKLITDYQNAVNQVAYDTYNKKVQSAAGKLGKAQAAIESFVYDSKATAFKDVEKVVNEAKAAGAIDTDGTIKDKFYAVKMDKWYETLDNVDDMLDADRDAACEAEKAKRVDDAKALYKSERDEIAGFGEINNAEYLKELDKLKMATIDVAEAAKPTPDKPIDEIIDDIIAKCEEYATYSLKDGKFVLGHSSVYTEAYDASVASQKNIEAYNRMAEAVDLLVSNFDDVKASVEKLIVGHQDGDTYAALTSIINDLESAKSGLEETKAAGDCVMFEGSKFVVFKSSIGTQIESLKETALSEEIEVLNSKIGEVKEEYNQVAKEDLDAVKDYDEKIQALYKGVDDIKAKLEKEKDPSTMFDGAVDALVEQEKAIANLNQDLNSKYENTQTAEAVAAVNAAIEKAEADVALAGLWADYNDATKAFAEAEVQALRGELERIKGDYEAKNAAGQLLFFKDNILFDLDNLLNDTPKEGCDLEALYKKHVENDNVYNTLSDTLAKAKDDLATAYDKIKDFEHKKALHEVDLIESLKKGIEDDFTALGGELETMHKNVELTKIGAINNDINELSSRIYDLERGAKAYEAMGSIYDLVKSIDASLKVVNGSQYGGDRRSKLTEEYNRLKDLLTKASEYNDDAVDGWISKDIGGNDVRELINGYKYDVAIDYNTDAWNSLQTRIAELKADAEQLAKDVVDYAYLPGDVDHNGKVNVNDYSEVRNIILNAQTFDDVDEAKAYAADFNQDKDINVADLTGMSNFLLHGKWDWSPADNGAKKTRAKVSAEDEINISNEGEETTIFGKTVRMAVNLAHSEAFTAGQMDITMPQGMKIVGQSMSDRANGHDIFANDLGNGVTRLLTATIDNNEFNGRNGALIYLDVEVSSDFSGGQISIGNIIFSDAAGRMYSMSSIGGNGDGATGIDGIKAATVKERIYSVGGQMMKAVKKGINIIVGEDGKARKIVNK